MGIGCGDESTDLDTDTDTDTSPVTSKTCEDFDECVSVDYGNGYACPDDVPDDGGIGPDAGDAEPPSGKCLSVTACDSKVLCISMADACEISCKDEELCVSKDTDPAIITCEQE